MSHVRASVFLAFVLIACSKDSSHSKTHASPDAGADADSHDSKDAAALTDASDQQDASAAMGDASSQDADTDAGTIADASADAGTNANQNGRPPRTNISFETAAPVKTDGSPILKDVVVTQQTDYYQFTGTAGSFYELETDDGDYSPDLTMTLYDDQHKQIADNDTGSIWPGDTIDARLVVRLPRDGVYFVKLQDPYTPASFFDSSFPLLFYHLQVRVLDAGATAITRDVADGPAPVKFVHDANTGYDYVTLIGTYNKTGNDTFAITGDLNAAMVGHVLSNTTADMHHTGLYTTTDSMGHVVGHIDLSTDQSHIEPPISDGQYTLTIAGTDEPKDAAYAVDVVMLPDNPSEQHEADNGALDKAEDLMMQGIGQRRGLLLSQLPASDIDYYKFMVNQDEYVSITCEAESVGSGVRGLQVDLRSDSDRVLTTGSETASTKLSIQDFQVSLTGTYYAHLSSKTTADDANAIQPWARCAVGISPQ